MPDNTKPPITIDTSKMALVDKEGLLDDLHKRLKDTITESTDEAVELAKKKLDEFLGDTLSSVGGNGNKTGGGSGSNSDGNNGGSSGNNGGGSPPRVRRNSSRGRGRGTSNDEISDILKSQRLAREALEKMDVMQKKVNKEKRAKELKGNVYSDKGKGIAEDVNDLADKYQTFDKKELEEAQRRLSDLQEGVRTSTFGKENELLTKATAKLQVELAAESKKRDSALGKIGNFLDRENINAASIITGLLGDSPLMGLVTKATLEMIRHYRQKGQKKKADKFKVGDIKKALPRPDMPQDVDHPEIDQAQHDKVLGSLAEKDPEATKAALETQERRGQITSDKRKDLEAQYLRPGFTSNWENSGEPQDQTFQPQSPTPVSSIPGVEPGSAQSEVIAREGGLPEYDPEQMPRFAGPPRKGKKGKFDPEEGSPLRPKEDKNAQLEAYNKVIERDFNYLHGGIRNKQNAEPQIMAKPQSKKFSEMTPEEIAEMNKEKFGWVDDEGQPKTPTEGKSPVLAKAAEAITGPVLDERTEGKSPVLAKAAEAITGPVLDERPTPLSAEEPEADNGKIVSILKGMKKTEDNVNIGKEGVFGVRLRKTKYNPLLIIEQLSREQLIELKAINKSLASKLDREELDKEEKLRETKDRDSTDELGDALGGKGGKGGKEGKGGILNFLVNHSLEEYLGMKGLWKGGKALYRGLRGTGGAAEGAAEGAEGAAAAGEGAAAAGEGTALAEGAAAAGEGAAAGAGAAAAGAAGLIAPVAVLTGAALVGTNTGHSADKLSHYTFDQFFPETASKYNKKKYGTNVGGQKNPKFLEVQRKWMETKGVKNLDRHWYQPFDSYAANIQENFGKIVKAKKENAEDFKNFIQQNYPDIANTMPQFKIKQKSTDSKNSKNTDSKNTDSTNGDNAPQQITVADFTNGDNAPQQITVGAGRDKGPVSDIGPRPTHVTSNPSAVFASKTGGAATATSEVTGKPPIITPLTPTKETANSTPGKAGRGLGMKVSDRMLQRMIRYEKLRHKAYNDPPGSSTWSIGVGHQIKPNEQYLMNKTISDGEAMELLRKDTESTANLINRHTKVPLSQDQFDVLVDFGHSGPKYLLNVLETLNTGDYEGAVKRMQLYNKIHKDGKLVVNQGLVSRRQQDAAIFYGNYDLADKLSKGAIMENNDAKILTSSNLQGGGVSGPSTVPGMGVSTQGGTRMTKASTEQATMTKVASMQQPSNTVIAPMSNVKNANTTIAMDPKATNSETTYQRAMNANYAAA